MPCQNQGIDSLYSFKFISIVTCCFTIYSCVQQNERSQVVKIDFCLTVNKSG